MQNNITEGNKLIAEFMCESYCHEINCRYRTSWDWLMPVVEKIDSLGKWYVAIDGFNEDGVVNTWAAVIPYRENTTHPAIVQVTHHSKIQAVWLAVVEFIQWYNTNNSK